MSHLCGNDAIQNLATSREVSAHLNVAMAVEQQVTASEDDHGESFVINHMDRPPEMDVIIVRINNIPVKMIIDSGASVNLLDRNTYHRLCQNSHHCTLSKSATTIFTCGSKTPLPIQWYVRRLSGVEQQ